MAAAPPPQLGHTVRFVDGDGDAVLLPLILTLPQRLALALALALTLTRCCSSWSLRAASTTR